MIKTDPTVKSYVTVPSAVNLFVAAVCWLVCLFFLLFGRTALIGGVKERECEVQVSDMLLRPSIRIDFHSPLVAALTGFHPSLFCNCCCCLFFSSRNSSSWWLNKDEKPCLAIRIFQWSTTTQVSSKSEWPTHRARYKTVVRPFFRAPHSLWYGGTPKPHLRQRLNETKISLDHRLAGFLSTAFYNLQSSVFLMSVRNRKPFALKTAWSQVMLLNPPILHDTIF